MAMLRQPALLQRDARAPGQRSSIPILSTFSAIALARPRSLECKQTHASVYGTSPWRWVAALSPWQCVAARPPWPSGRWLPLDDACTLSLLRHHSYDVIGAVAACQRADRRTRADAAEAALCRLCTGCFTAPVSVGWKCLTLLEVLYAAQLH